MIGREARLFVCALQFLTRLPTPPLRDFQPEWIQQSARWFPLVGQVVGLIAAAILYGAAQVWSPWIAALLAVAAGVALTGGFHEDGLADTADGLGGGQTRARRLEIMKDSRLGSYGALTLGLTLALRVAALAMLVAVSPWMAAAVYGWKLKRSLMRVTNMMHQVKAGVSAGDPDAMKLLRFYHLGLTQMHRLDGNSSGLSDSVAEIDRHREAMEARNMDTDQPRLESGWVERVG
ncbi:adenosylcobinamide-GDP ribazoletransferase, partial [Brevundimonas sp. UBA5936]|uniref:adenosylcobinamide-GDP ribazoletransferase n=1 Tax=Brevundimonas sp. UBA5936 TaxID=1946133 RepID=UPI0025BE402E